MSVERAGRLAILQSKLRPVASALQAAAQTSARVDASQTAGGAQAAASNSPLAEAEQRLKTLQSQSDADVPALELPPDVASTVSGVGGTRQQLEDRLQRALAAEDYAAASALKKHIVGLSTSTARDLQMQLDESLARQDYAAAAALKQQMPEAGAGSGSTGTVSPKKALCRRRRRVKAQKNVKAREAT